MGFQMTFSDAEWQGRKRTTRKAAFLENMDSLVPWGDLVALVDPLRPHDTGGRGRRPWPTETLLRMYLVQCWFNLSDEAAEDACYDSSAVRAFVGTADGVPDATTLLRFRRLVEDNSLGKAMLDAVNCRLERAGLMMRGGSMVDATIIEAPSSTKNRECARDPEMHQAKKGNQWHHGMKAHVAADAGTGYAHSSEYTAANEPDVTHCVGLLRPDDSVAYADSGYRGVGKYAEAAAAEADREAGEAEARGLSGAGARERAAALRAVEFKVAAMKSKLDSMPAPDRGAERRKASVRSHVEHIFHLVKDTFGYRKCRYRGLAKNGNRIDVLLASANLVMMGRAGWQAEFHAA